MNLDKRLLFEYLQQIKTELQGDRRLMLEISRYLKEKGFVVPEDNFDKQFWKATARFIDKHGYLARDYILLFTEAYRRGFRYGKARSCIC